MLVVYRGSRTRSVEYDRKRRSIKSFSVALNTSFIVRNNNANIGGLRRGKFLRITGTIARAACQATLSFIYSTSEGA
jgi:hypothetical protein